MDRRDKNFKLFLLLTAQRLRELQLLNQPLSLAFAVDEACFVWHGNPVGGEILSARFEEAGNAYPLLAFTGSAFDRWMAAKTTLARLLTSGDALLVNADKLPRRLRLEFFLELLEADRLVPLDATSQTFSAAELKLHRLTVTPEKHLTFENFKPDTLLLPLDADITVAWRHAPSPLDEFVDVTGPEVRPVRHEKTAQSLRLYRLPQGLLELAADAPSEFLIFDFA